MFLKLLADWIRGKLVKQNFLQSKIVSVHGEKEKFGQRQNQLTNCITEPKYSGWITFDLGKKNTAVETNGFLKMDIFFLGYSPRIMFLFICTKQGP